MLPYLDLHTHHESLDPEVEAIQSLNISGNLFLVMPKSKAISVGLHPWWLAKDNFTESFNYLKIVARQANVKMIGEAGLDKIKGADLSFQLAVFECQIRLAEELAKPIIIHCVRAFDELIALKKKLKPSVPLIIHGFNKKGEFAKSLVRQGFYLSYDLSMMNNSSMRDFIRNQDVFFLETDESVQPINQLYEYIAQIKAISIEELKQQIHKNWQTIGLI